MYGCHGGLGFFGGGWYSWIGMLLHAAIFIGVIYLLVRLVTGVFRPKGAFDSQAILVLKEQYARGEISREEYLERKQVLEK